MYIFIYIFDHGVDALTTACLQDAKGTQLRPLTDTEGRNICLLDHAKAQVPFPTPELKTQECVQQFGYVVQSGTGMQPATHKLLCGAWVHGCGCMGAQLTACAVPWQEHVPTCRRLLYMSARPSALPEAMRSIFLESSAKPMRTSPM